MNGDGVQFTCTSCGVNVHPLDVFPFGLCLECHAAKHENDTPEDLLRDILNGFGGKR